MTPIGAEVIETKDNWNYSRGFLFTKAIPFYHFGARVTGTIGDRLTVGTYLVNGWDNVRDSNTAKSVGFNAAIKPGGNTTFVANYLVGKENPLTDDARHILKGFSSGTCHHHSLWWVTTIMEKIQRRLLYRATMLRPSYGRVLRVTQS